MRHCTDEGVRVAQVLQQAKEYYIHFLISRETIWSVYCYLTEGASLEEKKTYHARRHKVKMQVSCSEISFFSERFFSHSRTMTKLLRRVSEPVPVRTKAATECLDVCQRLRTHMDMHERRDYPVTNRSSLIELRSEFRQNSPKTDEASCIWLEVESCINSLLNATIAATLGLEARVSWDRMTVSASRRLS